MAELAGTWTYRSFNPAFVRGNETPQEDALIFADDIVLTLRTAADPLGLEGTIEWEGGGLKLDGTHVVWGPYVGFDIVGTGRPGTATDGWEYRYHGITTPWRPNVTNERPTLVGSVIRVKDHNGVSSPAGYVASFIAMKQQPPPGSQAYSDLTGKWDYRSFHNNATYALRASPTANGLILQEAVFKLKTPTSTTLEGTIELPDGGVLDIGQGIVPVGEAGEPPKFAFVGIGRSGTKTDGWEYSYDGHLTPWWPQGVNQRRTLVGSVIRVKSHNGWQWGGGVALPFIAVKQTQQ
jgi:hypothetical protein